VKEGKASIFRLKSKKRSLGAHSATRGRKLHKEKKSSLVLIPCLSDPYEKTGKNWAAQKLCVVKTKKKKGEQKIKETTIRPKEK